MNKWPTLSKPPVAVALLQLKYSPQSIKLERFNDFDNRLKNILPLRRDNINVGFDLTDVRIPLGKSTITSKTDAKVDLYVYLSQDQKTRLEISDGTITYLEEGPYTGWENFKENAFRCIMVISEVLENIEILRTSIRFINRFMLPEFNSPEEYFTSLISRTSDSADELPFPLRQYSFRLAMDVPDSEIYAICNHAAEPINPNVFAYTLDIDVLSRERLIFEKNILAETMENLREVKNQIFFSSTTQKTRDLCI